MKIIETKDLTKVYNNKEVVSKLNFEVEAGKVFGFLGPNGAGKTTTIRMFLNLVKPTSGTARILGFDVKTEFGKISPNIAAIVENPTFFPGLTALQTLKTFADYANLDLSVDDYHRFLDRCGILYAAKQKVESFSLGMKQRLGLAVALLNDPKVIFLDEPSNGLDPEGIVRTRQLIQSLAKDEQKTIFVSSHLLHEVEVMCDNVAILNKGKILVSGKVADLLNKPQILLKVTPFKECKDILEKEFPTISFEIDENKNSFYLNIDEIFIPKVIEKLVHSKINIYQVSHSSQSLEQFFHQTIDSE